MTKPKGVGRGNNPNSHSNRKLLGKEAIEKPTSIKLLPHQKQCAEELGAGNVSDGIRKVLDLYGRDYSGLTTPGKLVAILTAAQSSPEPQKSDLIAEALEYIESWSIERSYEEAIAEGVFKAPGDAYIV